MSYMRFLVSLSFLMLAPSAFSETESATVVSDDKPYLGVKRVGGQYMVSDIEKIDDRFFRIEFTSIAPSGRFDKLILESDHVHVAVKEGQTIRLSAEILSEADDVAEVAQMVIFLPNMKGRVPVWLLSTKAPAGELRGSTYLEMHVPLNDYTIM